MSDLWTVTVGVYTCTPQGTIMHHWCPAREQVNEVSRVSLEKVHKSARVFQLGNEPEKACHCSLVVTGSGRSAKLSMFAFILINLITRVKFATKRGWWCSPNPSYSTYEQVLIVCYESRFTCQARLDSFSNSRFPGSQFPPERPYKHSRWWNNSCPSAPSVA